MKLMCVSIVFIIDTVIVTLDILTGRGSGRLWAEFKLYSVVVELTNDFL